MVRPTSLPNFLLRLFCLYCVVYLCLRRRVYDFFAVGAFGLRRGCIRRAYVTRRFAPPAAAPPMPRTKCGSATPTRGSRSRGTTPQLFQAVADAPPSYGKSRLLVETPAPRSLGLPIMPRVIAVNCERATVSFSGICGGDGSLFEESYCDLARGDGQSRVIPQMANQSSTRYTARCQGTGTPFSERSSMHFSFFCSMPFRLFLWPSITSL